MKKEIRNDLKAQLHCPLMLLRRAWSIRRNFRRCITGLNNFIVDQVLLDFLAADIREHVPVDFNTRRQRLSAFGLHLPAKRWILDDVLFRVRKIVFGQNGAHAGTPATVSLEVSGDLRRLHLLTIPQLRNL
jgi:hypothetical protein